MASPPGKALMPAPPTAAKTVPRNPNIVASEAKEACGGANPLLARLYSSSVAGGRPGDGVGSGVPNILSTSAAKNDHVAVAEQAKSATAAVSAPLGLTATAGLASAGGAAGSVPGTSMAVYAKPMYSDADLRGMFSRHKEAAAMAASIGGATMTKRRQTPPARLQPLVPFKEGTLATTGPTASDKALALPAKAAEAEDAPTEPSAALQVVARFRNTAVNTPKEFTYLMTRPRGIRDLYNPYDLVVVSHKEVDPKRYFTISATGVTKFDDGESEFIDLKAWEREHRIYHKLVSLNVFKLYKKWKGFGVWRKLVRRTKIQSYKSHLNDNLFLLHPDLSKPLRLVRSHCLSFQTETMYEMTDVCRTLQQYSDAHEKQQDRTRKMLDHELNIIKGIIDRACKEAMATSTEARDRETAAGAAATADATKNKRGAKHRLGVEAGAGREAAQQAGHKPSYIELSQKRAVCRRLTNYIRLCDYLVITSLSTLCMKALRDAHLDLKYPRDYVPPPPEPEKDDKKKHRGVALAADKKKEDKEKGPYLGMIWSTELLYLPADEQLAIEPNMLAFTQRVDDLIKDFVTIVSEVPRLAQMELFKVYTEFAMVDQGTDNGGFAPAVKGIVEAEPDFKPLTDGMKVSTSKAFNKVEEFKDEFQHFADKFKEMKTIGEHERRLRRRDLDEFRTYLADCKSESEKIDSMRLSTDVAVFAVKAEQLQKQFTPQPVTLKEKIHKVLPEIAKEKNDQMNEELTDYNEYLNKKINTIEEYVEYTEYYMKLMDDMKEIKDNFSYLADLIELMRHEGMTLSEEDMSLYDIGTRKQMQRLEVKLQQIEDNQESERRRWAHKITDEFAQMRVAMSDVMEKAKDPMVEREAKDPEEIDKVIAYVTTLLDETDKMLKRQNDLLKFQRLFEKDEEPIEELKDVLWRDVNDKAKLWNGLKEWNQLTQEIQEKRFAELDAAKVNEDINKFFTLSKSLYRTMPSNVVVIGLKQDVEHWKSIMPIVTALKNKNFKSHHKEELDREIGKIEDQNKVERDYTASPDVTLGMLLEHDILDKRDVIIQISVSATEEEKLSQALKKVTDVWEGAAAMEFQLANHKDAKDLFILKSQSVEEIQSALDDALLTVSTLAASKYCQRELKVKVTRWEEDLRTSQDTLGKWLEVQKNWMYLENVFGSNEIRTQWKMESKQFEAIDHAFKNLMRQTYEVPNVFQSLIKKAHQLLKALEGHHQGLESVLGKIEKKLEERRRQFPRFYFLSNDDLLDVLAKTRQPELIMPHMLKMFDGIKALTLLPPSNDITTLLSMEGEKVELSNKTIKAGKGKVEEWLKDLEREMFVTLQKASRTAVEDLENHEGNRLGGDRDPWIFCHPVQLVLIVSAIFWTKSCEHALTSGGEEKAVENMGRERKANEDRLTELARLTGAKLNKVRRAVLSTLITLDVHGRDLVDEMYEAKVKSTADFGWSKQLRCYWQKDETDPVAPWKVFIKQNNSRFVYGYEYLGAQGRLVITPLTDRIYMTITGALKMYLGAAPAGPAGTGKTETTKDLAKNLARQCIVYNCSDGVTYKMMEKFFLGLIQTGAWTCLDEFNRINIEVLSVIAAQVHEIREALSKQQQSFTFQGTKDVTIRATYGCFITMNPGYAGRTELPDNLKILFRPVAVMTPDFRMIAEVILFSEGFTNAKDLSLKITQLYKLSSEQLSPQDHYDFGMRALKSILVMAGDLKRSQPDVPEDHTLIVACNDSNIPKFVAEDVPLFNGIMQDLFPGISFPDREYPELKPAMLKYMEHESLSEVDAWMTKGIQFFETMIVRHGVMLVGVTGTGKTQARNCIAQALTTMSSFSAHPMARKVGQDIINPKSIYMGELYGALDSTDMWKDGHLAVIAKKAVKQAETINDHSWIVFDGPVDTLWIESMNSVLDDSKLLCLDNGDRLKFPETIHLLFEVADLAVASPATVSRCGMVYIDGADMPWRALVERWSKIRLVKEENVQPQSVEFILSLFDQYIPDAYHWYKRQGSVMINGGPLNLVQSCCDIFSALMREHKVKFPKDEPEVPPEDNYWADRNQLCRMLLAFGMTWSFGGNVDASAQEDFHNFITEKMDGVGMPWARDADTVFGMVIDFETKRFQSWKVPQFNFNRSVPFFELIVPTIDTLRYSYLAKLLVGYRKPVLFSGHTGVGKSVIMNDTLVTHKEDMKLIVIGFQFSAQTTSPRTQEMIESKLKASANKLRLYPSEPDKHVIFFIDDLNMPALETFGASPPVELLRQMMSNGGFFDRKFIGLYKTVEHVTVVSACGPPDGGRNPTTPRLTSMYNLIQIPNLSVESMGRIFNQIVAGYFNSDFNGQKFVGEVRDLTRHMVQGSVDIFNQIRLDLRPRPATAHYTFNLRDLAKVFQGIMQVNPPQCNTAALATRLWVHENMRCFYDRLTSDTDRSYFTEQVMMDVVKREFNASLTHAELFEKDPIIWGDFLKFGLTAEERRYEENRVDTGSSVAKLRKVFEDYLDDFNTVVQTTVGEDAMPGNNVMNLVFFKDHCEHLARITRIVRQPRGNALLVGVGGSGKQSLTRLATHIAEYKRFELAVTKAFGMDAFHERLLEMYTVAGVDCKSIVFLLNDTQIVNEGMLEDINNILNSGEVPSLFTPDERDKKITQCMEDAQRAGINQRDEIYQFFINRVRDNFHIVLAMSPVGDAFRTRCRQFPSLTNCCAVDWFDEWPREALLGVAQRYFDPHQDQPLELNEAQEPLRTPLTEMCVEVHASVVSESNRFWEELRRRYYITPTSYLEFIDMYRGMLKEKSEELQTALDRLLNGQAKMTDTNSKIAVMSKDIEVKKPQLEKAQKENEVIKADLSVRKEKAAEVQARVAKQEAEAAEEQAVAAALEAEASAELAQATPILAAAEAALDKVTGQDISFVKTLQRPSVVIVKTISTMLIFFEPYKSEIDTWSGDTTWKGALQFLTYPRLLDKIRNYDKDNIKPQIVVRVEKALRGGGPESKEDPELNAEVCGNASAACKGFALWMHAMVKYAEIIKVVKPKREAQRAAQESLDATNAKLHEAQSALKAVEDELNGLTQTFEEKARKARLLEEALEKSERQLKNAQSLTESLKGEAVRWSETIVLLKDRLKVLPVEMFLAAACCAYFGAFTAKFRRSLTQLWLDAAKKRGLPVSDDFSLIKALGNDMEIMAWRINHLPTDDTSTENAIILTRSFPPRRWPLMIDPQGQAAKWIASTHKNLKVMKLTEDKYIRSVEQAIKLGHKFMIDDVGETLDPSLEPLLMRAIYPDDSGSPQIKLINEVPYDDNFRFFICTKLANPHYLPDVSIKVTLLNFTVTQDGLEDQMLGEVVGIEERETEAEMTSIIKNIAAQKKELKATEDSILKKLSATKGNILDDTDLIEYLKEAQQKSESVQKRSKEAETRIAQINGVREMYRPVANRSSILFFVLTEVSQIDPMYQYSLEFFKRLVATVIEGNKRRPDFELTNPQHLDDRLRELMSLITKQTYLQVCRGLFNRDKVILSLLMTTSIFRNSGNITDAEWQYFIRATALSSGEPEAKPTSCAWATKLQWELNDTLAKVVPAFKGLLEDVGARSELWESWVNKGEPHLETLPGGGDDPDDADGVNWEEKLTPFQKILLIRSWREEKLLFALTEFIRVSQGQMFVEAPPFDLDAALADSGIATPIVFVLSQGADPMNLLLKFADKNEKSINSVSLGQGQGENAKQAIEKSKRTGEWALLQNCHLSKTFMPDLEAALINLAAVASSSNQTQVKAGFRLWLTSMPTDFFPVYVLQNSIKLTNEPPTGLKANMTRCYNDITPDELECFGEDERFPECSKEAAFKKILFGMCFFHSIILERKKFGPLGWNVLYEWNDTDFHVSKQWLQLFLKEQENIPWESLEYVVGQINYGGRVTDPQDRGTLMDVLIKYITPKIISEEYKFSSSGKYRAPPKGSLDDYKKYISELSLIDDPEVFGMHENANLRYQLQRSQLLMGTVLTVQPRLIGKKGSGPTPEEQVTQKCQDFQAILPDIINKAEEAGPKTFTTLASGLPNSMSTVLSHELVKYNALLRKMAWSLEEMQRALKGLTVLSADLDRMYQSFLNDQVPALWSVVSYASLKPLGAWFRDFVNRVAFIRKWVREGEPVCFWIGGFFNSAAFMTGTLQAFARSTGVSVDKLGFSFRILDEKEDEVTAQPESGAYVSGIFSDAWRWDSERGLMAESLPGVPYADLPVVHFLPEPYHKTPSNFHRIPMYRTTQRKGNISSLGASSNFILCVEAATDLGQNHWVMMGAAAVTSLDN